ncbi:hypothetical protein [Kribbella sindirgiensis]|uniref:Uncharacterized protein n=1 Tax=Kribbella sindirgiensis TaxID=1124744 RepID=A0A4R0J8Q4_9ACTN|nr:hypothetical protein [Kribbella sindirgiensis]TCC43063.1 hypothetical protein E0H50_00810 [Kribbella sindirgiensis]
MTQSAEAQFQAAKAAQNNPAAPPAPPAQETEGTKGGGRPSNLMLAGAGSIVAVLAFLGGMAVGHSWDGTSNQQGQFGGGRGFPGGFQQGNGQGQGTLPGQGQGQRTQQGQGNGTQQVPGQTRTS